MSGREMRKEEGVIISILFWPSYAGYLERTSQRFAQVGAGGSLVTGNALQVIHNFFTFSACTLLLIL